MPWTEEPGGLQSTRSQRVGHDWVTAHSTVGHTAGWAAQADCLLHSSPSPAELCPEAPYTSAPPFSPHHPGARPCDCRQDGLRSPKSSFQAGPRTQEVSGMHRWIHTAWLIHFPVPSALCPAWPCGTHAQLMSVSSPHLILEVWFLGGGYHRCYCFVKIPMRQNLYLCLVI